MSDRWSIENRFTEISYKEFQALTAAFQQAVARSFGTEAAMEIRAMNRPKLDSNFLLDESVENFCGQENEKRTFLKANNSADVSEEAWQQAAYVEVSIKPVDEAKAPASAWGHLEFKGVRPRQATFYVQGGDAAESVKKEVLAKRSSLSIVGDGYKGNSL